jgi:hypothetical protein
MSGYRPQRSLAPGAAPGSECPDMSGWPSRGPRGIRPGYRHPARNVQSVLAMTIRLALIAAACLGAAGCSPSMPSLSGTFSSLRTEEPPRRTCRNVASDAVALSARASLAAGVPVRDPRIGEAGVTEVAWPSAGIEAEPNLPERMASLQAESDASGCALAFRESLPPTMSEITAATAPPPRGRPGTRRSSRSPRRLPAPVPCPQGRPRPCPPFRLSGLRPQRFPRPCRHPLH